jgi:hypothetical protein
VVPMESELNNPIKDFYELNKEKAIVIPQKDFDESTSRINKEMLEYAIEYREKLNKSIEKSSKSFLTF